MFAQDDCSMRTHCKRIHVSRSTYFRAFRPGMYTSENYMRQENCEIIRTTKISYQMHQILMTQRCIPEAPYMKIKLHENLLFSQK